MAYWGKEIIFDGISCEEFHLSVYDIQGSDSIASPIAGSVEVVEETIAGRWKPFFYGTTYNNKLEFELVLGIDEHRLDNEEYLTRREIDEISAWLIGHNEYKWLEIVQDDIDQVRFKAIITNLKIETNGNLPYALRITVTCDSPYAYEYPTEYSYTVNGTKEINFFNPSCINTYYRPIIVFKDFEGSSLEIINNSDSGRIFKIDHIPPLVSSITINNDSCVITNDADVNLYSSCNFGFLRLARGLNKLVAKGIGQLIIRCEFPHNIGG